MYRYHISYLNIAFQHHCNPQPPCSTAVFYHRSFKSPEVLHQLYWWISLFYKNTQGDTNFWKVFQLEKPRGRNSFKPKADPDILVVRFEVCVPLLSNFLVGWIAAHNVCCTHSPTCAQEHWSSTRAEYLPSSVSVFLAVRSSNGHVAVHWSLRRYWRRGMRKSAVNPSLMSILNNINTHVLCYRSAVTVWS